jgi:hypothetical protein
MRIIEKAYAKGKTKPEESGQKRTITEEFRERQSLPL